MGVIALPPDLLSVPQKGAASVTTGTMCMYFYFVSAPSLLLSHSKTLGSLGALLRFGAIPSNYVPLQTNTTATDSSLHR